jgi:tetratricopeptide (TPR) repeat protein
MSKSTVKDTTRPAEAIAKPSNADYPVEPAERVSQQERLRKAAAAGADALKSPLPSLISLSTEIPQKPVEALPKLAQSAQSTLAAPNADPVLVPRIPAHRIVPTLRTKDSEEILAELRKISAWADLQRKITKWSFIFLAVFIPAMIVIGALMEQRVKTNFEGTVAPQKPGWYEVERNVRAGLFEKAIAIGEELILKTPQDPEAHQRLAGAYLASGNIEKAKEHYAEAFRLFPSEENEKLLLAIEKRSKADQP